MATGPGIELTAKHNPLAWMLYFTKLTVAVDGDEQTHKWGSTFISLPPGPHDVAISFRYMGSHRGKATATVTVPDGANATVTYKMPSWMFAPGKLTVAS